MGFRIRRALRECCRHGGPSAEFERRAYGSSRPKRVWVHRQKHESDNAMANANRVSKPIIVNSAELDRHR